MERPREAEGAERSKERRLKLFPGSREWKTPLLGWWGQRELEEQVSRVILPWQAVVGSTGRYWDA